MDRKKIAENFQHKYIDVFLVYAETELLSFCCLFFPEIIHLHLGLN